MKLYKNTEWQKVDFNNQKKNLPINWGKSPIGEIIIANNKSIIKASESKKFGKYPFFNCSEVQTKNFENYLIDGENIFITTGGDYMFNLYFNGKAAYSTDVWAIKIKEQNTKFINYFLKSNFYINQSYFRGFKFKHLDKKGFKQMIVPLPPKQEQSAIASILSSQESIISKTKDLIANLDKRNKFMMDELLSGRLRVKEEDGQPIFYKNADDNWQTVKINGEDVDIPKDWTKDNLGSSNIPFIKTGVKKYVGELEYYATGEVDDFCLGEKPTGIFTYDEKPSRANVNVLDNSIYLARMKNTLKIIKFKKAKNILLSTGFLGLLPNTNFINLEFLYFVVQSEYFQHAKNKECKGATQETLSDGGAQKIEIKVPHISEQIVISKILDSISNEKQKYEDILKKEEQTFTFLLEELMSGRLRVEV